MYFAIKKREKVNKRLWKNSLLVAIFIFETLFCRIINIIISIPYISIWLMLILLFCMQLIDSKFRGLVLKKLILGYAIILIILGISVGINGINNVGNYLSYFLVFGTTGMLISALEVDYKRIIIYLLRFSVLYSLVYFVIERKSFISSENYWTDQMGMAYGVLIIAVTGMSALMFNDIFKFSLVEKIMAWVSLIAGSFIIFFDCGTRGAMVTLIFAFVMLVIAKCSSIKKLILIMFILIIGLVFLLNMEAILVSIYNIFSDFGIDFPALTKMISMMQSGTADNGRDEIYMMGIEVFKTGPLIGRGVGYFESLSGGIYVHNIILELLCEIGIVGTICVFALIMGNFVKIFLKKRIREQEIVFYIILFLVTVPLLCFSSSYWLLPSYWLYFGVIIRNLDVKKTVNYKINV